MLVEIEAVLTHQQRVTIAAQEICLRRVEPQLWQQALLLAKHDSLAAERIYTRLRCRQIELLAPAVPVSRLRVKHDPEIAESLRRRSNQWLWDAGLLIAGVNCAGLWCLYFWGGI